MSKKDCRLCVIVLLVMDDVVVISLELYNDEHNITRKGMDIWRRPGNSITMVSDNYLANFNSERE